MNKLRLIKISILPLLLASAVFGITGCQFNGNIIGISDYCYDDQDKYVIGAADLETPITNINIDWVVGNVKVMPHNLTTVSFLEESDMELEENMKLRYYLDETTLRIRFCSCGEWDFSKFNKDLTVLIPETLALSNLEINSLSSNASISNCEITEFLEFKTLSGELDAKLNKPLHEFKGDSTSGSFKISAPFISQFEVSTLSGEVTLSVQKEPEWLDIDTTSGNINLALPKSASFTLYYDNTSGEFSSDLPYKKEKRKYIFSDGINDYNIDTVSGNVSIKEI